MCRAAGGSAPAPKLTPDPARRERIRDREAKRRSERVGAWLDESVRVFTDAAHVKPRTLDFGAAVLTRAAGPDHAGMLALEADYDAELHTLGAYRDIAHHIVANQSAIRDEIKSARYEFVEVPIRGGLTMSCTPAFCRWILTHRA